MHEGPERGSEDPALGIGGQGCEAGALVVPAGTFRQLLVSTSAH